MSTVQEAVSATLNAPIKLDIGCGKNKQQGFIGIDIYDFPGVDIVADLRLSKWECTKVPDDLRPRMANSGWVKYESDREAYNPPFSFLDNSVDEARASHFLEHLTNFNEKWERVHFFNELYRILKPGAQCQLIFPHWASNRYYGDPTHKEPFSEMGFYYLSRAWRLEANNAPHADISINPNGYSCDFEAGWGYSWDTVKFLGRNQEYIQFALQNYKEAANDLFATITKRAPPG